MRLICYVHEENKTATDWDQRGRSLLVENRIVNVLYVSRVKNLKKNDFTRFILMLDGAS